MIKSYKGVFGLVLTLLSGALYIQNLDLIRLQYYSSDIIQKYDLSKWDFRNTFSELLIAISLSVTIFIIVLDVKQLRRDNEKNIK